MKFGMIVLYIVLQVNMHRLMESDFWYRYITHSRRRPRRDCSSGLAQAGCLQFLIHSTFVLVCKLRAKNWRGSRWGRQVWCWHSHAVRWSVSAWCVSWDSCVVALTEPQAAPAPHDAPPPVVGSRDTATHHTITQQYQSDVSSPLYRLD